MITCSFISYPWIMPLVITGAPPPPRNQQLTYTPDVDEVWRDDEEDERVLEPIVDHLMRKLHREIKNTRTGEKETTGQLYHMLCN